MCGVSDDRAIKVLVRLAVALAARALPVALVAFGGWKMWHEHNAPAPSAKTSEALRASAERAAETVLPTPTLGADPLAVQCAPENLEAELQRIVRLARGVGGSASFWNNGSTVRVMAGVPSAAEEIFRDAVRRGITYISMAGASKPSMIVEVVVSTAPAAEKPAAVRPKR